MIKKEAFSQRYPSHDHMTYTLSKWAQTTYSPQTSCKVTPSHHKIITNTFKLSHVMSKPPSHVSTSRYETSHWWPSRNGFTQEKEFKSKLTWKHIFQSQAFHIPISLFTN
jgi:hypothetical protein